MKDTEPNVAKSPNGSGASQSSNLMVLQTLRKHWPTALATAVLVLIGTAFYTLGQKKIYEAHATIMFDPTPPRPLGRRVEAVVDMGAGTYWDNQEYYETQYHIIRSRRVALMVVLELGLQNDAAFLQNIPKGEQPLPQENPRPEIAAEVLRGRLTVQPVRDSRLATVRLRDANPERSQRLLTTLVEAYKEQNLSNARESTSSATDWLRSQLDTLKSDLETSELALHQYKKDKDILSVAFDDKSSMLADEMKQINSELTRVRAEHQQVAARRSVLRKAPAHDPQLIQSSELMRSHLLNILRAEYEQAVRDRDALLGEKKGENHPEVAAANGRVKAAEAAILKEIKNVKRAVDRDVAVLSRQSGGLKSMLDKTKTQAHDLNLLEIEYNRLSRAKDQTEKLYSLVLERTKEADLTQMLQVNNISIVDMPMVPRSTVHPRVPLNLAVGLFAGILLGVVSAFLRGMMDRTLKVPDDLEKDLGVTCLGLLPELSKGALPAKYAAKRKRHRGKLVTEIESPELIVHDQPTSSIAEASRAIRTNLMFMAPDNPHRALLITSAGPSEGKTTVACCIAVAMAQAGQRVVLIDCDLRRPRVHRIFGRKLDVGVTTALLEGEYQHAVFQTRVPNLEVLTSGPVPPNPAELLHTERFRKLLDELKHDYDRVIIDSPPIAVVTDPAILSTLVDGTVLVARAFKTRKELARHALRSIRDVGGKVAGAVLNAVDFSRLEYKYDYYYYRRDEYYGSDVSPTSESRPSRAQVSSPPAA